MKLLLSALALVMSKEDLERQFRLTRAGWLVPFLLSTIAWAHIMVEMVYAYRNVTTWIHATLVWLSAFLFAGWLMLFLALITSLFIFRKVGMAKAFYFGLLACMPIVAIALISLVLKMQFGLVRVLGYFPEHPLIIGAYLTIFSHVRLVSLVGKWRAIVYLLLLTILVYILLGPVMFRLFSI